MQIFMS